MPANITDIEKRLWDAADELRANSKLKSSEYSVPVLGLIFLRYADHKFALAERELAGTSTGRRTVGKIDYQARGVLFLPEAARFSRLLAQPEGADIGQAINDAMRAIEAENEALRDVLPKTYNRLDNRTLFALLKNFNSVPMDIEGDAFGKIYEYFLGKFAMSEGQKGGEFFTPTSIVKLIVEIIEPFGGRIFDPACGSGGMFVQSARFVSEHRRSATGGANGEPGRTLSIFGQEKVAETVRLCRMNLAVNGLEGDIDQGNSYYEDPHNARGKFDFVMANPPFNVDKVDKERLADDPRFPFGLPKPDNANYLWIQLFYSSLNATGRAGFVMANSAADARGSELEIRRKLIEAGAVDVMVAVGSNFFYTVTLPCTLWFLDRGKGAEGQRSGRSRGEGRHGAVPGCAAHLPAGGSRAPRVHAGTDRIPGDHRPPLPRGKVERLHLRRDHPQPDRHPTSRRRKRHTKYAIRRHPRPLQGGDPRRDRGPGLEPEPRPLRGRGRARGRRRRLARAVGGAERGAGGAEH